VLPPSSVFRDLPLTDDTKARAYAKACIPANKKQFTRAFNKPVTGGGGGAEEEGGSNLGRLEAAAGRGKLSAGSQ